MDYIVAKFGGWANAASDRVKLAADLFEQNKARRVKVNSAIGKVEDLPKVTDLLIKAADHALQHHVMDKEIYKTLKLLHYKVFEPLGLTKQQIDDTVSILETYIKQCQDLSEDYFRALIMGAGEELFSKLDALYLDQVRGLPARYVDPAELGHYLVGHPLDGKVALETYTNLKSLRTNKEIIVYPGFFGIDHNGRRMVYSRGGTDKTAADIAAATDASLYENWKDVDGVYAADPRTVKQASQMQEVTYKEIRELSYINFKVLHQEAMLPVMKKSIPICLRNLSNQANSGTSIVGSRKLDKDFPVIGIAHKENMVFINIEKILLNEEIGFTNRLLKIFSEHHLNIDQITTGIDSICLVVDEGEFETKTIYAGVSEQIRHAIDPQEFSDYLQKNLDADLINIRPGKALICVVGEGMRHAVGLLDRIARILAQYNINIEILDQGPSERNVIIGIDNTEIKDNAKKTVNLLYEEFFFKE